MVGNFKQKLPELPLPRKVVNQKQQYTPEKFTEIKRHHQGFEGRKSSDFHDILIQPPIWPLQQTDRPWRITMDCCKHNHAVILIAGAAPDAFSLLEKINTYPGTRNAATGLTNAFVLMPVSQNTGSTLLSAGKDQ